MRLQLVLLAHAACAAALTVSEVPRAHRPKAAPHLAVRMAASSGTTIEVTVRRSADGGLGIQVDETNTVASCPGQPELAIGDRIVALNGEELGGRYLAEVLPQADQYTFAIQRDSADAGSMERRLQRLTEQVSADTLLELSKDEVLTGKIVLLAEALEAEAEPQPEAAVAEALRGFWRLAFTNGTVAAGLTGYGSLPFCYVSGLFSAFTEKEPTAQVVEVVADRNLGGSNVAALKGEWEVLPAEGRGMCTVSATYSRLEYAGSRQTADVTRVAEACTFLGDELRVGWCNGAVMVWQRSDPASAQREIARLMELRVRRDDAGAPRDDLTAWERADLERKGISGPDVDAGAVM